MYLKTYEIILKNTREHPLPNYLFKLLYLAVQVIKLLKENLHLHTYKYKVIIIMILKDVYIIVTGTFFLTLNIIHAYSPCSVLKTTDQCSVSCYATNYT
jgi:hypothetical protein